MRRHLRRIACTFALGVGLTAIAAEGPAPALAPPALEPLPLGAIKPAGWLRTQLETQAKGLGGRLDLFWPDIKQSAWIGGDAEGWERVPCWLDGVVPLAYLLDDPALQERAKRFIDAILERQQPDGWLGPVRSRLSGDVGDRDALFDMLAVLDRWHGQATGIFACDEHVAGRSPSQGTELCTVVEAMHSLEEAAAILGDARLGDRLDRIACNAPPATFKKDMSAHQYDQPVNQVLRVREGEHVDATNGPDSNLFGLEPNFGCCTANFHRGWPKLASHLWMKTPAGGLAVVAYAPCVVETEVRGKPVRLEVKAEYPFRDAVEIVVTVPEPLRFPLELRAPARAYRDEGGSTAILRGPLAFAPPIPAAWTKVREDADSADREVRPTDPWNYALDLDPARIAAGAPAFSAEGARIRAEARGRRLEGWGIERGAAAPPPRSPAASDAPAEALSLIPYGCTDLRVAEFPTLHD